MSKTLPIAFSLIPDLDKLNLTDEQFLDSVRVEAISKGFTLPVDLSNLPTSRGFEVPARYTTVYEIQLRPSSYSTVNTKVCYADRKQALASLAGLKYIDSVYNSKLQKSFERVVDLEDASIVERYIPIETAQTITFPIKEDDVDDTSFYDLLESCRTILSSLRQQQYNNEVRRRKQTNYLTLARGDLEIAKAFWSKTEGTPWGDDLVALPTPTVIDCDN